MTPLKWENRFDEEVQPCHSRTICWNMDKCVWAEIWKVVMSDFYIVCVADSCIVRLVDFSRNTSGEVLEISEVELELRGFSRFRSYCVLQHAHSMRIRSCDTEKKKAG